MDENVKKISFYIFLFLVFIFIIYIIFLRPNANTNIKPTPKFNPCDRCPDPKSCDPLTGKCIALCRGKEKLSDDFICKEDELPGCKNSYLPTNIDSCSINDLKCDKGFFYCQNSKECNNGDLYFTENGNKCICPDGLFGPKCEYNDSQCKNEGKMGEDGICKCKNNTYYGDKCETICGENKIYDSKNKVCICDTLFYDIDGDTCKKKECGQGKLNGEKCECDPGYTGDKCDQKICNENQVYNNNKCECKPNKDGLQYYGKNCDTYNCNLESEFKYDEASGPSCDCSIDPGSCGKYCEFTKSNKCNTKGTPVCVKNNKFLKCICDDKDKPLDINPCLGIDYVCNDDGTWIETDLNCNDLLSKYGNLDSWNKACFNKIFKSEYDNGKMICDNRDKDDKDKKDNCSKTICAKPLACPNKPDKTCEKGKLLFCDNSTTYNWDCRLPVHNNGNCPSTAPTGYCIKNDGTFDNPQCFQCGNNGSSEWICENQGALPSISCLNGVGIKSNIYIGYKDPIYRDSQKNDFPIYPTTNKQQCSNILSGVNKTDPYSNGQYGNINITTQISNPIGTIDLNTFTDLTDYNNHRYFNVKSDDFNPRCLLTDDDIVKNILKSDGSLCSGSGSGTFIQDKNGDYYLPSGNCTCDPGFAGKNCQFSDSKDCNGKAKVDNDGSCSCSPGFAGKNCQFSDSKDCNNNGSVDNNGKCTCKPGYIGNNCELQTGYYCHEDGICKEGTLPINETKNSFFNDQNSCNSKCIPKIISNLVTHTETTGTNMGFICSFGDNASKARDACNAAVYYLNNNDPLYNFSCSPHFDGGEVRHDSDCNIYCDCHGDAINTNIYTGNN